MLSATFCILARMRSLPLWTQKALDAGVLLLIVACVLGRGGKGLEATWLLGGAAVVLTLAYWTVHRREPRQDLPAGLWVCLMAFWLWTLLSYLRTTTGNYGLDEVLRDGALALIFLWSARASRAEPRDALTPIMELFVRVIIITSIAACAIGMAVYILQPVNRFVGSFFYFRFDTDYWPNAWAEFVLLAWPLIFLWLRKPLWRIGLTGFVLAALFLSYSRGAFIVFCGQVLLLGVLTLWQSPVTLKNARRLLPPLLTPLLTATVAILLFAGANAVRSQFHDVESVARKATFSAAEGVSSISERREFWQQSLALSLKRPLTGWGPYSFRFIQPRLQQRVYATSDHAHNVFLKLAMERGWPAAILYGAIIVWVLGAALLRMLSGRGRAFDVPFLLGALGVFAHNLIDYNLQFVGIALPLWMMMGFLAPVRAAAHPARLRRASEILMAILIGVTAVWEGRMLLLSSYGRHAEAVGSAEEALLWYDRAKHERFSRDLHLSRSILSWNQGNVTGATEALGDYMAVNPHDARAWLIKGGLQRDRAAFEEAYRLGKYNYLDALRGLLSMQERGTDEARARQEEFEKVFHAYAEAILLNTHFIALSDNAEKLQDVSAHLGRLYPASAAEYRDLAEKVLAHAQDERERLSSRSGGMLW